MHNSNDSICRENGRCFFVWGWDCPGGGYRNLYGSANTRPAPPYNPLIFVDPSGKYGVVIYDSYPYEENTTKDI